MQDVNIYIETSFHGPARKDGEYLYLLECIRNGAPATREGRGAMERATENQLALTALAEALGRLNCPCELRIYTTCQHIINAMQNSWARQWQKNEWRNAKGTPVKNADLWEKNLQELDPHRYLFTDEHHEYRQWMQSEFRKGKIT